MNIRFSRFISASATLVALPVTAAASPASENLSPFMGLAIETESVAMFAFGAFALILSRRLVKST